MNDLIDTEFDDEKDDDLFEHFRITVDKGQEPLRIDKFLMNRIQNATRNKIQNGIDQSFVLVNDKSVKSNYKVKPADVITISFPEPPRDTDIVPENIALNIVFEDDD